MKKLNGTILLTALLLTVNCLLPTAQAQGPGFDEDVEDTPVDGGVTLIVAAAVGYGIKRLRDKKREK